MEGAEAFEVKIGTGKDACYHHYYSFLLLTGSQNVDSQRTGIQ